jgi:hypothetical protein
LSGSGWTYHALELEMTIHVLAFTLMMYAFVRRLTGSVFGAFVSAIIVGYSGYLSSYPPLQLALLEAGIWLPLAALGILEATRKEKIRWGWLVLTGLALGMSWMAGHPQTSYFLTYLLVAYFGYRAWTRAPVGITLKRADALQNRRIQRLIAFIIGVAIFGLISFGLAAVQFLPSVEYLLRTTRAGFGYDAKSNGFPLQDMLQFFIPGVVSQWSPLWIGISGLTLALIAFSRKLPQTRFWGAIALLALLWSFGSNSAFYPLLYNVLPGLSFFRGQERAAYLVVDSLAILAGIGATWLTQWDAERDLVAGLRLRLTLNRAFTLALAFGALIFVAWVSNPDAFDKAIHPLALTLIVTGALYLIISLMARNPQRAVLALAALLVFELFSFNMDSKDVYDHVPPTQQISLSTPPLIAQTAAASTDPFFVDGARGLTDNFGSLYGVMDIHGISPLFLNGMHNLIETDLPDPVKWTLLGVRYVYTDWQELAIPSTIVATGTDRYGAVNLHQLETPRSFATILYRTATVSSDDQAYALLHDPNFDYRRVVILDHETEINNSAAPDETPAAVVSFAPENIIINASTPTDGILILAMPQYPGWYATVDDQPVEIMRAYGALAAIQLKQGDHLVRLVYNPLSYRVGVSLSLFTWLGIALVGIVTLYRQTVRRKVKPDGIV